MTPELIVLFGPDVGRCLVIDDTVTVGRSNDCDFTLGDDTLSPCHLTFSLDETGLCLEDMGTGSTTVNGKPVERLWLVHLDEIRIGETTLQVRWEAKQRDPRRTTVNLADRAAVGELSGPVRTSRPAELEAIAIRPGASGTSAHRQMVSLLRMIELLSRQASVDALYGSVCSAIGMLLPFRDVVVLEHDAEAEQRFRAVEHRWGAGSGRGEEAPKLKVNRALIELCVEEREGLAHEPPDGDLVLVTPMCLGDAVLGVTYIVCDREAVDSTVALDLLTMLSGQAALVAQRCRLEAAALRQRARMERAFQVLEHEEGMLRAVLDSLAEGVILAHSNGVVILHNQLGGAFLDAACERSPRTGRVRRMGGERFKAVVEPLGQGQDVVSREVVLADGLTRFDVSITNAPLGRHGVAGEVGVCLTFRDLSDALTRRGREQARRPTRTMLRLDQLVGGVVDETRALVADRGIELHVLGGELPLISADAQQVERVLLDLLRNASQAIASTGRGGLITVRSRVDGDWVEVRVLDDGPGLSAERQSRIFDASAADGGFEGANLAGAYAIVRDHGGMLTVDSDLGEGACYVLRLPVAQA